MPEGGKEEEGRGEYTKTENNENYRQRGGLDIVSVIDVVLDATAEPDGLQSLQAPGSTFPGWASGVKSIAKLERDRSGVVDEAYDVSGTVGRVD